MNAPMTRAEALLASVFGFSAGFSSLQPASTASNSHAERARMEEGSRIIGGLRKKAS